MTELITRKQAVALGLKQYATGKPCKRGHICERRVDNRMCVGCFSDRMKQWRLDNPDRYNPIRQAVYNREWYAANRDRSLAENKRWMAVAANRDRHAVSVKKWGAANPDKRGAIGRNYMAKKRGNGGSHTAQDIQLLLTAQGGRCVYCRTALTRKNKHVDHIVPIRVGGSNYPHNLQLTCQTCNGRKWSKDPLKFGLSIGVLNGRMAYAKVMAILGE